MEQLWALTQAPPNLQVSSMAKRKQYALPFGWARALGLERWPAAATWMLATGRPVRVVLAVQAEGRWPETPQRKQLGTGAEVRGFFATVEEDEDVARFATAVVEELYVGAGCVAAR